MNSPHRLDAFHHKGKVWTIDPRLEELRFVVYGETPEFVPFDSEKGMELMRAFAVDERLDQT